MSGRGGAPAAPSGALATAWDLLRSYDWESARETITLGEAVQRFRDVNGYVGLPVPAKPAFLKVFRRLINGGRPPEEIYRVHDASHVLTGTTFTHDEPPLVLLAGEAVEQGLYFASRGTPRLVGWVLFYGGAFVECARRIASFRQVFRGIRLGSLQSGLRLRAAHPTHQSVHDSGGRAVGRAGGGGAAAARDAVGRTRPPTSTARCRFRRRMAARAPRGVGGLRRSVGSRAV